jgi:hypothetical protein
MPERTFYLVVTGGGCWGGGNPFRTYKAGVHEISAEVAEAVLALKEKDPMAWLILTDERPEAEDGSLRPLLPQDLQPGTMPAGIRLLRENETPLTGPHNPKDLSQAPPLLYACQYCPARFPSAAAAKRHLRHHHVLQHAKSEARVRAQLQAEREQRAPERPTDNATENTTNNSQSRTGRT